MMKQNNVRLQIETLVNFVFLSLKLVNNFEHVAGHLLAGRSRARSLTGSGGEEGKHVTIFTILVLDPSFSTIPRLLVCFGIKLRKRVHSGNRTEFISK